MSKIVFFSIPAHGHTNPTIPVIAELVKRGHEVWYYSFLEFKAKIEETGARFIECDSFLPPLSAKELEHKAGKDFAALIEMVVDTTIAMDKNVCEELTAFKPDCIVSDSICFWGKLFAKKLDIRYICSTTTFAFNRHTAKLMKRSIKEIVKMIMGMPRIKQKVKLLQSQGYHVDNFISIIENNNETDTIVYTSKEFQPLADTFSDRYAFVGPSIGQSAREELKERHNKLIYISLGTVLNQNKHFYKHCLEAFKNTDYDVVMSVGSKTDVDALGSIPANFTIQQHVDQIVILQQADIFITHSGMNSVNESLYFGVPMVLFPQHSEQLLVTERTVELGAGIKLKDDRPSSLVKAVAKISGDVRYQKNAEKLAHTFHQAGGPVKAADAIEQKIKSRSGF